MISIVTSRACYSAGNAGSFTAAMTTVLGAWRSLQAMFIPQKLTAFTTDADTILSWACSFAFYHRLLYA